MRRAKAVTLVAAASCLGGSAHAGPGVWTTGGPAGGATVHSVAVAPGSSTVYAGTSSGIFRSTDSGGSWAPAASGPVYEARGLAADPLSPLVAYAATWCTGVYKTTDAGLTWTATNAGLTEHCLNAVAVDPAGGAAYVASQGGVYKSTDGGGLWVLASTGLTNPQVMSLAIDPTAPETLYAGTEPFDGGHVFRSTDGATTWSPANGGQYLPSVRALAVDPAAPATLYAGTETGGVLKSTDAGGSWAAANQGLPPLLVDALVVDPTRPGTVHAGVYGVGVYGSTDGGGRWSRASWSLGDARVRALALDSASATLFAGVVGGVWQVSPGAAKGDVNGDGQPDLVFRSVVDGARNKVWLMDGVTRVSEAAIVPDAAAADWLIRGLDDFDAYAVPGAGKDGRNDLVLWSQSTGAVEFWLMNGTERPAPPVPLTGGATLPLNWSLSATADFNADGHPDIVWRNVTSQKIVIWTMNGTAKTGSVIPSPAQAVDVNWEIVAAADYDGDGNRDFLWYNETSGKIVTWYMNARVERMAGQYTSPPSAGDANWRVVASADYSARYQPGTPPWGSPDIVWRNETSGNQVVWHLDLASTRVHGEFTRPGANSPALDWTIVGPR